MAQNKTVPTGDDVEAFLSALNNPKRRDQARYILGRMTDITGHEPRMWGTSIIGFDTYHYKHANGKPQQSMKAGFSPRKANLVVYIMPGFADMQDDLSKLGQHKSSKACLYLTDLEKVDKDVLDTIIKRGYDIMNERYPAA
jgi:hypothetical protein